MIREQKLYKLVFAIFCLTALTSNVVKSQTQNDMIAILESYDTAAKFLCNKQSNANWDVATDQTNNAKKDEQVRKS